MSNPFKDWTPEMVKSHQAKVRIGQMRARGLIPVPEPNIIQETNEQNPRGNNVAPACEASTPKPELNPLQAVEKRPKSEAIRPAKCFISIESRRVRIQDPDNAVAKFHIDALRYAGIIPDDTTAEIALAITQTKVSTKAEEGTVIVMSKRRHE